MPPSTTDISSGLAEWSIYYDPESTGAFSMAIDRASVLSMPYVIGYRVDTSQREDTRTPEGTTTH